ncbi:MAG: hypothetical protein WCA30_11835 [Dermatophilaceae bacterium]
MTASRLAVLAAGVAVVAWGLKAVAIGTAGGLDQSPLEGPLYVVGLVSIVVAFAALGVAVAADRSVTFKVLGAVVGVLAGFGLSMLASVIAASVIPDSAGWIQAEAGLWVSALLALGISLFWHRRRGAVSLTRE